MKVLLFTQTGDARPKCVTPGRGLTVRVNGEWWLSWLAREAQRAADRWWLVECESAEAGRMAIACAPMRARHTMCVGCSFQCCKAGHILASGGKP